MYVCVYIYIYIYIYIYGSPKPEAKLLERLKKQRADKVIGAVVKAPCQCL